MNSVKSSSSFAQEAFESWIQTREEPEFFLKSRQESFKIFESFPWPNPSMEEWRRTKIAHISFGEYSLNKETPASWEEKYKLADPAGVLFFSGYSCIESRLQEELSQKGVLFCSMKEALKKHSSLLQEYIHHLVSPSDGKFQALHGAFWTHGAFLYVPEFLEIQKPFQVVFLEQGEKTYSMPYLMVVMEKGARSSLFTHSLNQRGENHVFRNGMSEVFLRENSQINLVEVQNLSGKSLNFWNSSIRLEKDSTLHSLESNFGSSLVKTRFGASLEGPGSNADLNGIYLAGEKQHLDQRTFQHHLSPHTTSNLFYRGSLQDKAYSVYQGVIHVAKNAQRTNAFQTNNNLLLSPNARADSIPSLEILANDLKCSHGATVGKINEQEIFYLMSRGISRQKAVNLIVMGFFEQVLQKAPSSLKGEVQKAIYQKLSIPHEEDLPLEEGKDA